MKVAFWHFYTFRMRRGIETLVVSFANALAEKGVEVSIVTASPKLELFVKPDPRIKIFTFPTFRYFEYQTIAFFYAAHFMKHNYDYIFTFFADFGEAKTLQLLKLLGRAPLPLVLYLCYPRSAVRHRYDSFEKYGWGSEVRQVAAVAEWIAEEARPVFKQPATILPVGTDPEMIRPDEQMRRSMREKYGYKDDDVILLNVAALEKRKGARRVLEAMARLKNKFSNLKYFILGKGVYETELRDITAQLGLNDRVTFGGETAEHPKFYNMADIFVMLPDSEANSLAFHEAMSAALPVVASRSPGFVQTSDKNAVIFAQPDDPAEVDMALSRLIQDASLRDSMGKAGRQYVLNHCSWDKIAEKWMKSIGSSA